VQTCKRAEERSISDIIKKVSEWRKLYTCGKGDTKDGKKERQSLENAAKIVGVNKKSLDDYLLQLMNGNDYGFNFQKNLSEKMGVLRSYVKNNKPKKGEEL